MAKKSIIAREAVRSRLSKRAEKKRQVLRAVGKSLTATFEEKMEAQAKLQLMPRKSSKTALRRRCRTCGRPRGVYRKFGLCRIHLREAVMRGDVPGCQKSSW